MAFLETLAKARKAKEFKVESFEVESSSQEPKEVQSEDEDLYNLFKEIWDLKEETGNLKVQIKKKNLEEHSKNPLASQEIHQLLDSLDTQLESVIKDKENCLNILRSSPETTTQSNCLSLHRDRQTDLIQAFEVLVKIIASKQSHLANLAWMKNQDWTTYGQELENINKKLLHLEASLARNLQEIKAIREAIN